MITLQSIRPQQQHFMNATPKESKPFKLRPNPYFFGENSQASRCEGRFFALVRESWAGPELFTNYSYLGVDMGQWKVYNKVKIKKERESKKWTGLLTF